MDGGLGRSFCDHVTMATSGEHPPPPTRSTFVDEVENVVRAQLVAYGTAAASIATVWSPKAGMWFVEVEPAAEGAAAVSIGLDSSPAGPEGDELVVSLPHTYWEIWRGRPGVGGTGERLGGDLRWADRGGGPWPQPIRASAVVGWTDPERRKGPSPGAVAVAAPIDLQLIQRGWGRALTLPPQAGRRGLVECPTGFLETAEGVDELLEHLERGLPAQSQLAGGTMAVERSRNCSSYDGRGRLRRAVRLAGRSYRWKAG